MIAAVVGIVLLGASVPATAGPAGARTVPSSDSTPTSRSTVRCVVLETYPRGTLRGCTDGSVRFEVRKARR